MTPVTNEITATIPTPAVAGRVVVPAPLAAASGPTADAVPASGAASLPGSGHRTPDSTGLDQAVQSLNDRYAQLRTDLRFTVDESTGRTVVAVVDSTDGTVLRQIPTEEVLRIAHALSEPRGALIRRTA